jgi:hypothetical protein
MRLQIRHSEQERTEWEIADDSDVPAFREALLDVEILHRSRYQGRGGEISAFDPIGKKWIRLTGWMGQGLGCPVLHNAHPGRKIPPLSFDEAEKLLTSALAWIEQAKNISLLAGAMKWKIDANH